jgi:hypothetical protein
MRPLLILLPIVAASTAARANDATYTPLVDIHTVDPACRSLAAIPLTAEIPGPAQDAAISTASCMAVLHVHRLVIAPSDESVRALDEAIAPAIAIFDRVIAHGDAEHAVAALFMESDLYDGNAERIMSSVPRLSPQASANEAVEHRKRVFAADELAQPLRRRALSCRRELARVVASSPELTSNRNAVLAYMITHSRIVEAAGVAQR